MKSAFEEWAESKYGDSLMFPTGAVAAWNAAVEECISLASNYSALVGGEIAKKLGALEED